MHSGKPPKRGQSGLALIVGLVILTVLTMLSLAGMNTTRLEERMAGNFRDRILAFQGAETALRDAEAFLQSANLPTFDGTETGLMNLVPGSGSTAYWSQYDWTNHSRTASSTPSGVQTPRYVIEELPAIPAASESQKFGALQEQSLYKVTARSTGGSGAAVVILQSTIQR